MTFLEGYLAKNVLDYSIKAAKKAFAGTSHTKARTRPYAELVGDPNDAAQLLDYHLRDVNTWASQINFADLRGPRSADDTYVNLQCYIFPRHRRIDHAEKIEEMRLETLLCGSAQHFILLGVPGAGKTTSFKHLCRLLLRGELPSESVAQYPLVIRLRELNSVGQAISSAFILEAIASIFGMKLCPAPVVPETVAPSDLVNARTSALCEAVSAFLDKTKALLLLDGFDEIASPALRESALQQIRQLMLKLQQTTVGVTSRTGAFTAAIEQASVYELAPLTNQQISQFAEKWLVNDPVKAGRFIDSVSRSPYADTAIRPLTLAHLCAVFERAGAIPNKPKTVYRKILYLLLEDWDEQRSVRRASKFAAFEPDRKYEFLSQLAFRASTTYNTSIFDSAQLNAIYRLICSDYELPAREAVSVVKELESHTGLFLQCGFQQFEFAHKSLQEFLAAEFLVRLPEIPRVYETLEKLPNELAIAVTISSNPGQYLVTLLLNRVQPLALTDAFFRVFAARLVHERPDFRTDGAEIWALLSLYSKVIYPGSGSSGFVDLNEGIVRELEHWIAKAMDTDRPMNVLEYFRHDNSPRKGGQAFTILQKSREMTNFPLPPSLCLRKQFFDKLRCLQR
jgi:hypothetical protein